MNNFIKAVELTVVIDEVVEGFTLMVKAVNELDRIASEPEVNQFEGAMVAMGLELVADKVNNLLGILYAENDPEIIELARQAVAKVTAGNEAEVLVALALVGGIEL